MSLLWPLNNPDPATKSGGADYFSAGFISLCADPFAEAMSARVYVRLNDGTGGIPHTLLDFDTLGYKVLDCGRITRRREREFGIVQGQSWQVVVHNKKSTNYYGPTWPKLPAYDLPGCWCCIQGGFEDAGEWQTMAQGKIASASFTTDGTCTLEVNDALVDLINSELQRDYYFDTVGNIGEIQTVLIGPDSKTYNNYQYPIQIHNHLYIHDDIYTITFTDPTHFDITDGDSTRSHISITGDLTWIYEGAAPVFTIDHNGWNQAPGSYESGDTFVLYATAKRAPSQLTPIAISIYLIGFIAGITAYDVISGAEYETGPFFDFAGSWIPAIAATSEPVDSGADDLYALRGYWAKGSRVIDMIQDALKLVHASIYSTHTGQLGVWLLQPSTGATVTLNGSPDTGAVDILSTTIHDTLEYTYNAVNFKYLTLAGDEATYSNTDETPSIPETRSANIETRWRVRSVIPESAANIYINRFKDARRQFEINTTLVGALVDVKLGVAIYEPELHITYSTSDVTDVSLDLLGQTATIKTHNDPVAIQGYFIIGTSLIGGTDRIW